MLSYLAQDNMIDVNIHGAGLVALVIIVSVFAIAAAVILTD